MEEARRDFLFRASVAVTGLASLSGCVNEEQRHEDIDEIYVETKIDEVRTEVLGKDVYVNVRSYAEDDSLDEVELQYSEPGEEAWDVLTEKLSEGDEAEIVEPFNGEQGNNEFRTVAYLEGEEKVVSETEEINFLT